MPKDVSLPIKGQFIQPAEFDSKAFCGVYVLPCGDLSAYNKEGRSIELSLLLEKLLLFAERGLCVRAHMHTCIYSGLDAILPCHLCSSLSLEEVILHSRPCFLWCKATSFKKLKSALTTARGMYSTAEDHLHSGKNRKTYRIPAYVFGKH